MYAAPAVLIVFTVAESYEKNDRVVCKYEIRSQ